MKVILITGASSGMGKATAGLLAQNGYTVYAAARRLDKMKDLESLNVKTIEMDLANEHSMVRGVAQIIKEHGRIDILINNAGFGSYGAIEDMSLPDAKYQLEVNLFGTARLIQLVLPGMRENRFGKILNVTSIGGKFAMPFAGWYCASKFALEGLSDTLRMEVKQFGIDVIIIEPGGIQSEWSGIAINSLMDRSINSSYKGKIERYINSIKKSVDAMKRSKKSAPIVIAKLIKKGIEAKHPKTRYIDGYNAKMLLGLRKLLSDRFFDKVMMSQL
jgi:short-subunit dehydrogenase